MNPPLIALEILLSLALAGFLYFCDITVSMMLALLVASLLAAVLNEILRGQENKENSRNETNR